MAAMITFEPHAPGEPAHEFQHRALSFALRYGIGTFTLSELEAADSAAQARICQLPAKLDTHAGKLDCTLHTLRRRLQSRMQEMRAARAQVERKLAALYQEPQADQDAAGADQELPPLTPDQQATKLLRAALMLIMGPQDTPGGGGGRKAPLIPPAPTRPSPGQAVDPNQAPRRRF